MLARSISAVARASAPRVFSRSMGDAVERLVPAVGRLNHVAIAVPSVADASKMYRSVLGCEVSEPRDLPEHGVKVVFVQLPNTKFELMEPLGADSPIAGFMKKSTIGGIHHVCLEVADVVQAIAVMKKNGYRVLNETPKIGAHGTRVTFLHPKDCNGVLVELEEVGA